MNRQEAIEIVQNQGLFFGVAMFSSIIIIAIGVYFLWKKLQNHSSRNTKEGFEIFTLFMLGATAVIFLPVYYLSTSSPSNENLLKSVFLSLYSAMRVFILNADFKNFSDSIQGMRGCIYVFFSSYATILFVVAPVIFTFTIFHSFFRDTNTIIQFLIHRKANLYVFSGLNEESATMALSILSLNTTETNVSIKRETMIVFCDVPRDNEKREVLTDLLPYMRNKKAKILFMRKTVDKVDVSHFKNEVTFFLMDKSETKNIQDVTVLCKRLEDQRTTKKSKIVPLILVYASSPASGPLIDALCRTPPKISKEDKEIQSEISILKGKKRRNDEYIFKEIVEKLKKDAAGKDSQEPKVSVPDETVKQLRNIIDEAYKRCNGDVNKILQSLLDNNTQKQNPYEEDKQIKQLSFSEPFSIMRIDTKYQMAIKIVQELQDKETVKNALKENGSLTITLLGLGGIGKEILGTILWMFQVYGCRLIINVFDATGPELGDDPDAAHNLLYDQLAYEWPELMETNRKWRMHPQLRSTTEAYYDIRFFFGTDCFSNRFRRLFDTDPNVSARLLQSSIIICSLGDDDKNLEAAMMMRQLFEGKKEEIKHDSKITPSYLQPEIYAIVYDIQRSACVSSQEQITNYGNKSYNINTTGSMQDQYCYSNITKLIEDEKEAIIHHISWILTSEKECENPWLITDKNEPFTDVKKYIILYNQLNKYIHYEYFRRSSLAKAIHKTALKDRQLYTKTYKHISNYKYCRCKLCCSRITEHMRWNAYMRVNGYRYGKRRNPIAKLHPDLVSWSALSPDEQIKD